MKKLFGFFLLVIGIAFPGLKGDQMKDEKLNDDSYIKNEPNKKENLSLEEEQKLIRERLKGLGYFQ